MNKKNCIFVVGNRPQYIKLGYLLKFKKKIKKNITIIDSGQHYDNDLSKKFFKEFNFKPDINLKVGSLENTLSIAKILQKVNKILIKLNPELLIIFGDTNTTAAAAIACKHLNIKTLHIEAGERVFDQKNNPEETNRLITDAISDYYITSSIISKKNLINEGKKKKNIFFTGDILFDLLLEKIKKIDFKDSVKMDKYNLKRNNYLFATIHRKENTVEKNLNKILKVLDNHEVKILLPAHPRTLKIIKKINFHANKNLIIISPLKYLDTLYFIKNSLGVITDSGGIKREAFFLGKKSVSIKEGYPYWSEIDLQKMSISSNISSLKKNLKKIKYNQLSNFNKNVYGSGKSFKEIIRVINKL